RATSYELRATSYELRATSYELRATSYELQKNRTLRARFFLGGGSAGSAFRLGRAFLRVAA
ncbi:MAG: hypothetical protein CL552_04005, partial [Alcanivorax sp.]|nr:hypothetical protein [Alcanivorax sp.]